MIAAFETDFQQYFVPGLILAFFGWRFLRFRFARGRVRQLLQAGAIVVDVRSRGEFAAGSHKGSRNVPLGEFGDSLAQLDRAKPIILCCASGARSGIAAALLKRKGFQAVLNAGPWTNIP